MPPARASATGPAGPASPASATATATAAALWPEGKEKASGFSSSASKPSMAVEGRARLRERLRSCAASAPSALPAARRSPAHLGSVQPRVGASPGGRACRRGRRSGRRIPRRPTAGWCRAALARSAGGPGQGHRQRHAPWIRPGAERAPRLLRALLQPEAVGRVHCQQPSAGQRRQRGRVTALEPHRVRRPAGGRQVLGGEPGRAPAFRSEAEMGTGGRPHGGGEARPRPRRPGRMVTGPALEGEAAALAPAARRSSNLQREPGPPRSTC